MNWRSPSRTRLWFAAPLRETLASADFDTTLAWCRDRSGAESGELHTKREVNAGHSRLVRLRVLAPWSRCASERESSALQLLERLGLPCVQPMAWGVRQRPELVQEHFLATRRIAGAEDLERRLAGRGGPEDGLGLGRCLAELVARMHAVGFVHRDLFLRNILIRGAASERAELFLLDCRRGGRPGALRRHGQRGIPYDLAALDLDLVAMGSAGLRESFWARYLERCPGADRPLARRARQGATAGLIRRFFAKEMRALEARCERMGIELDELRRRWVTPLPGGEQDPLNALRVDGR